MVVLQNCVGFEEGETASYNETGVECDPLEIKEEVSIKVEETIDIKDEIPETVVFPTIKTGQEVRLEVCVIWWQLVLLSHLLSQNGIVKLHFTISCFVLRFG